MARTICISPPADPFIRSNEANFIKNLLRQKERKFAQSFNSFDSNVLSLNNIGFSYPLHFFHKKEVLNKETTDTSNSDSYLDFNFKIGRR